VYQSVKVLDEEENADKQLRSSHGNRWTRTPSERLTESIRAEAARYRQIIDNAVTADGIVRQRYTQHREGFELLSRSDVSCGVFFGPSNWSPLCIHCWDNFSLFCFGLAGKIVYMSLINIAGLVLNPA